MIKEREYMIKDPQFIRGVKDCVPTIFGYLSIGFACGVVSKSCGMSTLQIVAMSTIVYGGSSQFVAASMISSLASPVSVILTIFLVNLRHLLMSTAIAPYFKGNSIIKNFTTGILLTDESFALSSSKAVGYKNINYKWMLGVNITAYLNWIFASFLGAYFGGLIYDYKVFGLDFALPAMFIGLLISSIRENENKKISIVIFCSTAIVLMVSIAFVSVNTGLMIAAIFGALMGLVIDK